MSGTLRIYLGGLPDEATTGDVRALLERFGEVLALDLITDGETGLPRGFGFATMTAAAGAAAVAELDGQPWRGGTLRVNESHDRGAPAPRRSW
ncbi:MAG: RNA-binding protein [bacterium]|nr:RNA-binding protein [bacterium]